MGYLFVTAVAFHSNMVDRGFVALGKASLKDDSKVVKFDDASQMAKDLLFGDLSRRGHSLALLVSKNSGVSFDSNLNS